jgi:dipeptidyl aminopeptidase/acylaminoacyl peptidase
VPGLRRLGVALLAALLALAVLAPPARGADVVPGLAGQLIAPHSSGAMVTDVATGASWQVGVLPPVGISGHAAWSPDRSLIAISRFWRPPGERAGGSDILLVPGEGGPGIPIAQHDVDGALLGAPAWMPDGSGLFFDYTPAYGSPADSRIMYVPLGQDLQSRYVGIGSWPAVSPDGRFLLSVRDTGTTGFANELVIARTDAAAERTLIPADQFVQIGSPRFSPGGALIAFIGSLTRGEAMLPERALPDTFFKGVAAHGPPGDIWITDLYGSGPRQLTTFEEDEPTLAWSPDGAWLMMLGGGGLYLVRPDGSEATRRFGMGGFGGIDWR